MQTLTSQKKEKIDHETTINNDATDSLKPGINISSNAIDFVISGKPGQKVHWVGDYNDWSVENSLEYEKDLQGYRFHMPASAFGIYFYKWVVDGEWKLDPCNPEIYTNGTMGTNSMVKMPAYHEPFEVFLPESQNIGSKLIQDKINSKSLKESRRIDIYYPEEYFQNDQKNFPLLVMQDGSECVDLLPAKNVFDQLIARKMVRPFIGLLVSPKTGERDKDYIFNSKFEKFLANDLLDWAFENQVRISKNRFERAILGYSLGGLVSVRTALHHPVAYGLAGGESSAFWPRDFKIFDEMMQLNPQGTQFYLGCGNLDGGQQMTALMTNLLTRLGIQYQSRISIGGHDWYYWKTHLRHALQYFFPM